jgi:hypothetical protein
VYVCARDWLLFTMALLLQLLTLLGTVERERKKAEKQAKFDQKKKAAAAAAPAETSKNKEKKAKAEKKAEEEVLPAYVEETPAGERKSQYCPNPIWLPVAVS